MIKESLGNNIKDIPGNDIAEQYELFFGFDSVCECKSSMKVIERIKDGKKRLLSACFALTKFHRQSGRTHKTLDVKGKTSPSGYKKLSGEGIKGYQYKFKLDGAKSMLVNEDVKEDDRRLYVYLAEIGNYH